MANEKAVSFTAIISYVNVISIFGLLAFPSKISLAIPAGIV